MDSSIEAALSSLVEAPRLSVLASKTFSDHSTVDANPTVHSSRFGPSASGIRIFSSNTKQNLSSKFIVSFLTGAFIVGALLGLLCFCMLRCAKRSQLSDDDAASLVESGKHMSSSNLNIHKNNDSISDKLSCNGIAAPIISERCLAAYTGTLERRTKADAQPSESNNTHVSELTTSGGPIVKCESGNYICNITSVATYNKDKELLLNSSELKVSDVSALINFDKTKELNVNNKIEDVQKETSNLKINTTPDVLFTCKSLLKDQNLMTFEMENNKKDTTSASIPIKPIDANFKYKISKQDELLNMPLILPPKSINNNKKNNTPINTPTLLPIAANKFKYKNDQSLINTVHSSRLPPIGSSKFIGSPTIERRFVSANDTLLRSPPSPSRIPRKIPEKLRSNL